MVTRKRLILLVAGLGISGAALWVAKRELADRRYVKPLPVTSIDSTAWDFGVVRHEQATVNHTFQLSNGGPDPIRIKVRRLGCNCLALDCPEILAPQATAPITVEVEIRRREGAFSTRAVLETSDPGRPTIDLVLSFYGQPLINIDPPAFQFDDVSRGEVLKREFTVITRLEGPDQPLIPPTIQTSHDAIACEHLESRTTKGPPGGSSTLRRAEHRYRLRLDTGALEAGEVVHLPEAVEVELPNTPRQGGRRASVTVSFRHHRWLRGPAWVTVRRGKPGLLPLLGQDGRAFDITKVECSIAGLEARPRPDGSAPGRVLLSLSLSELAAEGVQRGEMAIYASEWPDEPYRVGVLVLP